MFFELVTSNFSQMGGKMIKKNIFIVRLCIVMFLIFLPVALPADLRAQTDVTAPVLVGLSFTPTTFDVSGGDQYVVFTWTLTDDTGVGDDEDTYTYLEIISPSGTESRYVYVSSSDITYGDMNNGVFETTVKFPQYYSQTGTWKIQFVLLRDKLGNSQYLFTTDLAGDGFNTDLIVSITPTADAGPDQTVDEGVTVTLDASNSSDPDPDDGIASYLWEQTDGTSVTLSDRASDQPTFTAPDVGPDGESLTFQLTVTDNGGLQAQDTCIVSVLNNTPPDIPTAVSPANELIFAEGPVTLKTSPFSDPDGDTHLQTHWLVRRADSVYYRSDYDPSFDQLMTAVSLTEHTVSGLEPGLKYVWKVGYVDSGSRDTSWSEEYAFKIGSSQADSSVWIVWIEPGTEATDFKMVSFIRWPDDPVSTSVFGDEMGESYGQDFRMGTYDPTSSDSGGYVEYGSNLIIEPGRAYWFLARDGLDITVNGVPVSGSHDIELGLLYNASNENGWNMIACPNNADYYWGDVEVVEYDDKGNILYGPTAISELGDDPNDYIDKRLWAWENGSYSYYPDPDDFLMKKYEGYWVKVKKANVFLRFPVSTQAGLSNLSTRMAIPDPDDSPPAPIGNFSVTPGGAGGDVGCFIATASYGSPMEGHVKTLRDLRDSYLLSYSILNYGPTITAIMLVFTLVFPIFFVSSYRRKMKG